MSERIHRIASAVAELIGAIMAILILASVAITLINVVGRYAMQSPIVWSEEVLSFCLVGMVFLGSALVAWDSKDLKMDLLNQAVPEWMRRSLDTFAILASAGLAVFMARLAWGMTVRYFASGQPSLVAKVPMWIPHSAVFAGFTSMAALLLVRFALRCCSDVEKVRT